MTYLNLISSELPQNHFHSEAFIARYPVGPTFSYVTLRRTTLSLQRCPHASLPTSFCQCLILLLCSDMVVSICSTRRRTLRDSSCMACSCCCRTLISFSTAWYWCCTSGSVAWRGTEKRPWCSAPFGLVLRRHRGPTKLINIKQFIVSISEQLLSVVTSFRDGPELASILPGKEM